MASFGKAGYLVIKLAFESVVSTKSTERVFGKLTSVFLKYET